MTSFNPNDSKQKEIVEMEEAIFQAMAARAVPTAHLLKKRYVEALVRQRDICQDPNATFESKMEIAEAFEALAMEGFAPAQLKCAGLFMKTKPLEALDYLNQAVGQGLPAAIASKGATYYRGDFGLQPCTVKAFEFYHQAAALGDSDAKYNLALMYMDGEGCGSKDYNKAAQLLRDLTAIPGKEDADACYQLGLLHLAEGMLMLSEARRRGHQGAKEAAKKYGIKL